MQLLLLAAEGSSGSSQLAEAFKQNPTFMVLNLFSSAIVLTIVIERLAFQLTKYPRELQRILRPGQKTRRRR